MQESNESVADVDSRRGQRLPNWIVLGVIGICTVPFVLSLLGVDFGSAKRPVDFAAAATLPSHEATDSMFHGLRGAFTHTLLEWSAFAAAIFTVLLAFAHYAIKRDPATPIIGLALVCSGLMDAFHTLAADRLIESVAENRNLIPFTWAIARVFNVLIIIAGVLICKYGRKRAISNAASFMTMTTLGFALVAYATIHICATSPTLPQTMFPDSVITRPWDVAPLVLWMGAGLFVFLPFYRRNPTIFSHGLLIAVIPDIATEAHMAFGSTALFDSHFNIAHSLKIVAYSVPLAGLVLEYVRTFRVEELNVKHLRDANAAVQEKQRELEAANDDLMRRNAELDEFSYVASHDLQEPLRKLVAFSEFLRQDVGDDLSERAETDIAYITESAQRMRVLVTDLLTLSRAGRSEMEQATFPLRARVEEALSDLSLVIDETAAEVLIETLPDVEGDPTMITQLYLNLISNALKFSDGEHPRVEVTCDRESGELVLGVRDNGIGIDADFHDQIFAPFKRLHGRTEYDGTGIGLAICRRTVERHGGRIWVESELGTGSHFKFTLVEKESRD